MSFGDDVERFARRASARADAITRKIVIDIGTALVMKSPVGDPDYWISPAPPGYTGGRFRANWQYGVAEANPTTTEEIDKSGSATIAGIVGKVSMDAGGKIHYITNSLPYARRLEDGWSKRQAPHGMIALTVTEFQPIVAAATRALGQ